MIGLQKYLWMAGGIVALCAVIWLWHLSEVRDAVEARDQYWTELIQSTPAKIDTLREYIPVPDTSGSSGSTETTLDSASHTRVDSLLTAVQNKDSLIAQLYKERTTVIDSSKTDGIGTLHLTYVPLDAIFKWKLTDRPPKEIITITSEKLIPLPFRTVVLNGTLDAAGRVHLGVGYRFDNTVVGIGYQAYGPTNAVSFKDRLQLQLNMFIF